MNTVTNKPSRSIQCENFTVSRAIRISRRIVHLMYAPTDFSLLLQVSRAYDANEGPLGQQSGLNTTHASMNGTMLTRTYTNTRN